MADSSIQSAAQQPDNVEQHRQAAGITTAAHNLSAKWREYHKAHLKALQTEWYAHNGKAKYQSAKEITQRTEQTTEYKPDDIT